MVNTKLFRMIREGEHQQQDFKFCINDSRKIARSLVAFANTDGGRLLIGVKDNGNIAGVQTEEEYYMIEAAAKLYSKPKIEFETQQWHTTDGKTVLQIDIPPSPNKPHYAKDENQKWLAYIRHEDQNILANRILLEVWKKKQKPRGVFIRYTEEEKKILQYLSNHQKINPGRLSRSMSISRWKTERILINLITIGVIEIEQTTDGVHYHLTDNFILSGNNK
ncbi:putative DNA-binding protein [Prolixibacter denitrificans]|nr:putative DNA-binding protein [Prolixibacter denitrificans]